LILGNVTFFKDKHEEKQLAIVVQLFNVVNEKQLLNVELKVVQTLILVGIVTVSKDLQPEKQLTAVVTEFSVDGKVTLRSDVHEKNVLDKVFNKFMLVGIVIDSNLEHKSHIWAIVVILFWALFGKTIVFRLWQILKVNDMLVIVQFDGIVIEDIEVQLWNIPLIEILAPTVVGKVTDVKL